MNFVKDERIKGSVGVCVEVVSRCDRSSKVCNRCAAHKALLSPSHLEVSYHLRSYGRRLRLLLGASTA